MSCYRLVLAEKANFGSYTIIQRYQAGAGPGPTACAGHSQMEMVSPDADGMMRP